MPVSKKHYIKFDGKCYAFDFKKMSEFVGIISESDKPTDETMVEKWGKPTVKDEMILIEKEVSRTNSKTNESASNIRYDILKTFMNTLILPIMDETMSTTPKIITDSSQMYLGQLLSFNTLIYNGVLVEVD